MNEKRKPYPFDRIEPKWQQLWAERKTFRTPNPGDADFDAAKPKFYVLDMFPYPSGTGLHVGHPEGYTATDIIARYRRMKGFNVLHPMGWDAFGLPAEQHAIKTGEHPRENTARNIVNFKKQLNSIGFNYDWEREVNTTDPGYFKWTQWIFRLLYESWVNPDTGKAEPISKLREQMKFWKDADTATEETRRKQVNDRRLAYVSETLVNWCPGLGTVLANEEVVDGKSEVGGFPIERRLMRQWMLRITKYADRLINELDDLEWPESIKLLQRNWIGRSEGAHMKFHAGDEDSRGALTPRYIEVFTTRPDTLFGATYLVLSPEHPMADSLTTDAQREAVQAYRASVSMKSDMDRMLGKEKTGVFTGTHAVNPVNGESMPIWIADYVLMGYGTGAIMAVPAHDSRDKQFASDRDLRVTQVTVPGKNFSDVQPLVAEHLKQPEGKIIYDYVAPGEEDMPDGAICVGDDAFEGEGIAVNSGFLNGLPTAEAKAKIIDWLEANHRGQRTVTYKLRDWLFSRQRYWGEPFPIIWQDGQHSSLPESELPLIPPDLDDFKPTGTGEPPLAKALDWVRYSDKATRETNTMPQWAGSCWYYLRYCDPRNGQRFVGEEAERYWAGRTTEDISKRLEGEPPLKHGMVDLYVGGTEHAVLHLLYARFWHKVLHDYGYVSTREPFQRLVNQGLILGEDGQKMSKSRGNVVNPDEVIADFGADALRLYEMFMGPLEQTKPWSMTGVQGVARFLARVWRLVMEEDQEGRWQLGDAVRDIPPTPAQNKVLHATIKKVTADIDALSFNTAIAQMMICTNEFTAAAERPVSGLRTLLQLLNPFAPHLTEELYETLETRFPADGGLLAAAAWPAHDEAFLIEDEIEMPIQINGKLRDRLLVKKDAAAAEIEAAALANAKVQEHLAGKPPRKVIVVPGKLVNIVA